MSTSQPLTNLERWHHYVQQNDTSLLDEMLHDDAVFFSPVVHTPQRGKALTAAYLTAAAHVLGSDDFSYVREFDCGSRAVLEFKGKIGDIEINGVDLIEWDGEGKIVDFKVMVRPLKAMQAIHAQMGATLAAMADTQKAASA